MESRVVGFLYRSTVSAIRGAILATVETNRAGSCPIFTVLVVSVLIARPYGFLFAKLRERVGVREPETLNRAQGVSARNHFPS